jgi:hypothetical protein
MDGQNGYDEASQTLRWDCRSGAAEEMLRLLRARARALKQLHVE